MIIAKKLSNKAIFSFSAGLDKFVTKLVSLLALLLLIGFVFFLTNVNQEELSFKLRNFGKVYYLYEVLLQWVLVSFFAQFLWFDKWRQHSSFRIFLSVFIIFYIFIERWMVLFTTSQVYSLPSAWTYSPPNLFQTTFFIIFLLLVFGASILSFRK